MEQRNIYLVNGLYIVAETAEQAICLYHTIGTQHVPVERLRLYKQGVFVPSNTKSNEV